ncbi:5'-adenylylsulfate reductase-like 4 [Cynara cardunculus var. scolymus]|uniref:5'-adenylylsulfate reductase-like 4 n=1 Tax=Cynara cardunculus var. scolymus TaxID=59895 RepID=UPI000D629ADE|nr:5'-adenylylsulfate reductase-like 4 [Cynara cardunculus var. scolymus]
MSPTRVLRTGLILLVIFVRLTCADELPRVSNYVCPTKLIKASIFGFQESVCPLGGIDHSLGVIEGDEASLQKALSMVDTNTNDYIVVLFYASWCPFSTIFRPSLSVMSLLYPSIPHFAIEEFVVKSSILSKYGVNGFPTLFVLNSTMRARYHGSRSLSSLVAFYTDVTGIEAESVDTTSLDKMDTWVHEKGDNNNKKPETCPFTWARSPESMLRQETYLALATLFVVLRSLYLSYPFIVTSAHYARTTRFRVRSLWEHPFGYLNRAIQLFSSLTGCMDVGFFGGSKQ